jgi:O-antigen/teichoic acid export membrane protein
LEHGSRQSLALWLRAFGVYRSCVGDSSVATNGFNFICGIIVVGNGHFQHRMVFARVGEDRAIGHGFACQPLFVRASDLALVHSPEDVIVVVAIGAGLGIISTVISFFVANRAVALLPIHFDIKGACQQIKAGASIFLATGGISLYTQSNVIMIGAIAGPVQAGIYSGGEKIQRALQGLAGPISAAVYPRINNLLVSNPNESHKLMRLTLLVQGGFTLCLSVVMFLTADIVTRMFFGKQYTDAAPIIRWLSAVPFLTGLSNSIG